MKHHRHGPGQGLSAVSRTREVGTRSVGRAERLGCLGVLCLALWAPNNLAETYFYTSQAGSNAFPTTAQTRIALGYRAVSLSAGPSSVSAVWLRDYTSAELGTFIPHEGVQSNTTAMQAKGFRPVAVAILGQMPDERYLISYVKDGQESSLSTRLNAAELAALGSGVPGTRVAWLECSGAGEAARYAAVLARDGLAGNLQVGLDPAAMQAQIDSYRNAGYRPVCVVGVAGTSGLTYTANWVQETKRWTNIFGVSSDAASAFLSSLRAQKLRPEVISQYVGEDPQNLLVSVVALQDLPAVWTITGNTDDNLAGLDQVITNAMNAANCTRAAFALSKDGRLVMSRGYTHHPSNVVPTQPTNGFRLPGVSKIITAVTVMGLVEAGKLQLDDKLGKFLDLSDVLDKRWTNITIRHLLQHRGGWDISTTFDPVQYDANISAALGVPLPITKDHIITYMKTRGRLQANPGSVEHYSNFGYLLLGRVIEQVTGQNYESFVRQNVLAPLGIHAARVGHPLRADALPGEVEYEEGSSTSSSVMSPDRPKVAGPYGAINLDNLDASSAWVFSAEDLTRFGSIFCSGMNCALLSSDTIDLMWSPAPQVQLPTTGWYTIYSCGWLIQGMNQGPPRNIFEWDALPGTSAFMVNQADGYCWTVLFNTRNDAGTGPISAIGGGNSVLSAIAAVNQWPDGDLFDADADGLPDSYERAYFGSLTASDGTMDHDADGLTDLQEWIALSSPVNAADLPSFALRRGEAGNPQFEVASQGGRVYSIRALSDLGQGWSNSVEITNFNGDGFAHSFELSPTQASAFYQLGISLRAKPR
jgi:CubicO group peptidase (beta-lactamase class C family)